MRLVRDQTKQPFSAASPWNAPLSLDATYQIGTDPETAAYRDPSTGGHALSYPWLAKHAIGVYQAKLSDPVAKWTYNSRPATMRPGLLSPQPGGGNFTMPTPQGIEFGGSDGWAVIIDPTGRWAIETWLGRAVSAGYACSYAVCTDLFGSGFSRTSGQSEGIRAAGCSLLGGLVRAQEMALLDIQHAIALALSQTQLSKGGIVLPATATDGGGNNDHTGVIPMGARFAVPHAVDLTKLGIKKPEGMALARALQRYGGIVVDTATNTNIQAYFAKDVPDAAVDAMWTDIDVIRSAMCMVTSVGTGAGVGAAVPLAGQ